MVFEVGKKALRGQQCYREVPHGGEGPSMRHGEEGPSIIKIYEQGAIINPSISTIHHHGFIRSPSFVFVIHSMTRGGK